MAISVPNINLSKNYYPKIREYNSRMNQIYFQGATYFVDLYLDIFCLLSLVVEWMHG